MGYGNDFGRFGNWVLDLFTFGGHSRERERERQEELNKLQMEREDTAYQRTVEDMKKAGLNPLTMSGTNNAQPLTNPIKSENNTFDKAIQLATTISSVATGLAQAKNLNASTVGMGIQNAMAQKDLDYYNKKEQSPAEYEHQRQMELAKYNKGFWGKVGNDIYDSVSGKINELIEKGTNIVETGIESIGKGEFKEAIKDTIDYTLDKGADFAAEKTGKLGETVKNYGEKKKEIWTSLAYQKMQYYQKEIDYWSKTPTPENLKKVNEMRKEYKKAEEEMEKLYGKHWRDYL